MQSRCARFALTVLLWFSPDSLLLLAVLACWAEEA